MPLIVEDGSIVASADSYVSEADAQAFLTSRGVTSSVVVESFLLQAVDYIESLDFIGQPASVNTQELSWPRSGAIYRSGKAVSATEIPMAVIRAQAWIANYIATGAAVPSAVPERDTVREKVDVVEEWYSDQTAPSAKRVTIYDMPAALQLLEPFLASGSGKSGIIHHA